MSKEEGEWKIVERGRRGRKSKRFALSQQQTASVPITEDTNKFAPVASSSIATSYSSDEYSSLGSDSSLLGSSGSFSSLSSESGSSSSSSSSDLSSTDQDDCTSTSSSSSSGQEIDDKRVKKKPRTPRSIAARRRMARRHEKRVATATDHDLLDDDGVTSSDTSGHDYSSDEMRSLSKQQKRGFLWRRIATRDRLSQTIAVTSSFMETPALLSSINALDAPSRKTEKNQNSEKKKETKNDGGKRKAFSSLSSPLHSATNEREKVETNIADQSSDGSEWQYLIDETQTPELIPAMTDVEDPASATDFVSVPFHLEKMIIFGQLLCLDSLLFSLTVLPIRSLVALFSFLKHRFQLGFFHLHHVQKIDILRIALVIVAFVAITNIPIPTLAQFIKRESLLKLKIMLTLLELMDRLLCSYGENILGSLFWAVNADPQKVTRGYIWHFLLSTLYIVLHSLFLLLHLSVLEVAVNSKNSTLMTLLILVQFAEMKGGVLKKFSKTALQKVCCEDIVERFQLFVFLGLLYVYNHLHKGITATHFMWALSFVYISEISVDWLKHTSIINFTRLPSRSYEECSIFFAQIFSRFPPRSWLTDHTSCLAPELGVLPLPLSVVVLKVMTDYLGKDRFILLTVGPLFMISLFLLLVINRKLIKFISFQYLKQENNKVMNQQDNQQENNKVMNQQEN